MTSIIVDKEKTLQWEQQRPKREASQNLDHLLAALFTHTGSQNLIDHVVDLIGKRQNYAGYSDVHINPKDASKLTILSFKTSRHTPTLQIGIANETPQIELVNHPYGRDLSLLLDKQLQTSVNPPTSARLLSKFLPVNSNSHHQNHDYSALTSALAVEKMYQSLPESLEAALALIQLTYNQAAEPILKYLDKQTALARNR
jgi:hypothetical protein